MFSWARKQRVSQRYSIQKSNKSCADTDLHSHPSSPAHSSFSKHSSKRQGSNEKLKIVLRSKPKAEPLAANMQNSMSRSQLLSIIGRKRQKKQKGVGSNSNYFQSNLFQQQNQQKKVRIIKVKIQVNRMLDQYCRAVKEFMQSKVWGIFAIASIMLKLGFIQDFVNDRQVVRLVWDHLGHPDQLGLYVFLQQTLNSRVYIDLALTTMAFQLGIKQLQLNKIQAKKIMQQRKCCNLYNQLSINRLNRQKFQQGQQIKDINM